MRQSWQEILAVAQRILIELGRRKRSLIFWIIKNNQGCNNTWNPAAKP